MINQGMTTCGRLDLMRSPNPIIKSLEFNEIDHTYKVVKLNDDIINPPSVTTIINAVFGNNLTKVKPDVLEKAKQKGIFVHQEFYNYCRLGENGLSTEFRAAKVELDNRLKLANWYGEQLVYGEDNEGRSFCGTIDSFWAYTENMNVLTDYKITYSLNKKNVIRQLNMYAYALRKQGHKIDKLTAWHIIGNKLKIVEIPIMSDYYVECILKSYYNGLEFKNDREMLKYYDEGKEEQTKPNEIEELIIKLDRIDDLIDSLGERRKLYTEEIMYLMNKQNLEDYAYENVNVRVMPQTTRIAFDSKKFKSDYPVVYEKYLKKTEVKPHLVIKKEK